MQKPRPLSPFMFGQVYKPQLTSMLSILHRGAGVFLTLGSPLLVYWLWTIATGPDVYSELQQCLNHWFSQLLLLGWAFSLYFHLCNGIRHLFWDVGLGYEIGSLYTSGKLVMVTSVILTAATWYMAISPMGGAQ